MATVPCQGRSLSYTNWQGWSAKHCGKDPQPENRAESMQERIVAVKAEAGPVTVVLRDARVQHRDLKYGVETLASPDTPPWQRVTLRADNGATLREVIGLIAKQFGEAKVDETMAAFAKETSSDERSHHHSSRFVAAVTLAFTRLRKAT